MSDCAHRAGARYCPDCGKDLAPPPYDRQTLVNDVAENWWEKGAIHTLAGLFVRPGTAIRAYIERDRDYLVKPIPYAAVVIAFVYWARTRIPGMGAMDTSESAALTLLMRDPLVPTIMAAMIGALVVTFVTHRPAQLTLYGAFVLRLYLGAQALLLMFAVDVIAVHNDARGDLTHDIAGYAISFGWVGFALWQYFAPDRLTRGWARAAAAVLLGEVALFLLLIIPLVLVDETGWLNG
jgi:Protein of unknown function (DUF3667)